MDPSQIKDEFPAPSYRGSQKSALEDIEEAFAKGNDIVLVRAPTGSGKSLLARAIAGCAARGSKDETSHLSDAFYTTPQVSQIDDIEDEPLLDGFNVVRGKSNYDCIHPDVDAGTPVHRAPCSIDDNFDCEHVHRCPYFDDRGRATDGRFAAMTLAYFMQSATSGTFDDRDVIVIDEAHGLAKWAEMHGTIELSPDKVPVWDEVPPPNISSVNELATWTGHLIARAENRATYLRGQPSLAPDEGVELQRLERLLPNLRWFVEEYHNSQTETRWLFDQEGGRASPVTIKPIAPERLLHHTLWDRANKFALLSATILEKEAFCRNVGLDPDRATIVDIEHTFPVENRPLFDVTCGKMTYEERDDTLPQMAEAIARVMAEHDSEKGLIHCHSYGIQKKLKKLLQQYPQNHRLRDHKKTNRDQALRQWKKADSPEVFLSVKMEEALDLKHDLCRWQVICKTPYPNTNDARVASRLENDEWAWYFRTTLQTIIQACGRVVRAPDDYGATYFADSSIHDLFGKTGSVMPDWFSDQVQRMTKPSLPQIQPHTH